MSDTSEIRQIVKNILKKHNIDPKVNKFKVFWINFPDLAREGSYFVEFNSLLSIPINVIDEIRNIGKEEDFILHSGITFKE